MESGVPYRRAMKGKTKFKAESPPMRERVTSHKRISAPALTFPFKKLVFTAMKIHSLSEKTVSVSLTLIFATDTGIALTAPLTLVTQTVFFVVKTLRSVTEQHCFVTEQHCFVAKQHCFLTKMLCFVTEKFFCINEGARPTWEMHCFISKQHCFAAKQCCFFMKRHCFLTTTRQSLTVKPVSGSDTPCFLAETLIAVTQTLASGADSTVSETDQLASETDTPVSETRQPGICACDTGAWAPAKTGGHAARSEICNRQSSGTQQKCAISPAIALADCTWLLDIGDRRMRIGDV